MASLSHARGHFLAPKSIILNGWTKTSNHVFKKDNSSHLLALPISKFSRDLLCPVKRDHDADPQYQVPQKPL